LKNNFPNPSDLSTFQKSKIKWKDKEKNVETLRFFQELISLRKKDPVFKECQKISIDGAVLGKDAFVLRYFGKDKGDRLLIFNFGDEFKLDPDSEPLLAPRKNKKWKLLWSSKASRKKPGPHLHILGHRVDVFGL
jgi:maltooligosyltrehalose trehalohydrolase